MLNLLNNLIYSMGLPENLDFRFSQPSRGRFEPGENGLRIGTSSSSQLGGHFNAAFPLLEY